MERFYDSLQLFIQLFVLALNFDEPRLLEVSLLLVKTSEIGQLFHVATISERLLEPFEFLEVIAHVLRQDLVNVELGCLHIVVAAASIHGR